MKSFVGQFWVALVVGLILSFCSGLCYAQDVVGGGAGGGDDEPTKEEVDYVIGLAQSAAGEYVTTAAEATALLTEATVMRLSWELAPYNAAMNDYYLPLADFYLAEVADDIATATELFALVPNRLAILQEEYDPEFYLSVVNAGWWIVRRSEEATHLMRNAKWKIYLAIEAMQGGGSAPPMMVPGF